MSMPQKMLDLAPSLLHTISPLRARCPHRLYRYSSLPHHRSRRRSVVPRFIFYYLALGGLTASLIELPRRAWARSTARHADMTSCTRFSWGHQTDAYAMKEEMRRLQDFGDIRKTQICPHPSTTWNSLPAPFV
ncbi:hypothetical protein BS47DRAFT_1335566 [Hydnum rufescens UP504]|uniref:Uncharacterized protein n=1 Tax=Hydnum rufescens UP504 TaxID=1448309 RepID=A0A9P6E0P7_9AGAM|nr:hypothetical protein BS47DRAFT_1335566 [Hydnum rufescens UP504]